MITDDGGRGAQIVAWACVCPGICPEVPGYVPGKDAWACPPGSDAGKKDHFFIWPTKGELPSFL